MLELLLENSCRKDIKLAKKRGKDLTKLWAMVESLQREEKLPAKHRSHMLTGNWNSFWECHVEPDWLLVYYFTDRALVLVRTGTHSDLF